MTTLIERLRARASMLDEKDRPLSDATQAADEIERLGAALKPFADAVYNDNGEMTVTPVGMDPYVRAYFVMRRVDQPQTGDGNADRSRD